MGDHIIVIGAALVDELYFCTSGPVAASSNPAILKKAAGGVARNIAHNLSLLDIPVKLFSVIGNDADGNWLTNECDKAGINTDLLFSVDDNTGKYASILSADGSLYVAACTDPCDIYLTAQLLQQHETVLSQAAMIIADMNIPVASVEWLAGFCHKHTIELLIEPVSVTKAKKISTINLAGVYMITPNEDELWALCSAAHDTSTAAVDELLQRAVQYVWVRKAANGSEIISRDNRLTLRSPAITIKDSTGAGDAALAGWVAARYMGMDEKQCLEAAHAMALEVLQGAGAVATAMSRKKLLNDIQKYYHNEE